MLRIQKVKWLYTLKEEFSYKTNKTFKEDYYYFDDKGNCWLSIKSDGTIVVSKNYSWDGCSPKIKLGKFLFGTWDGKVQKDYPITYHASLLHDVLYQFRHLDVPFTRKEIDQLFFDLMPEFKLKYVYYLAVRIFGSFSGIIRSISGRNSGRRLIYRDMK